ncbi:MAG: YIP1 family protein [Pseudomonadota bacterium]|nr:YIP1 family protein [Pseudomonadota bacterium]
MNEAVVMESKPLSQVERVVDTFVAPRKTFTDILRSSSWWLPFLIIVLLSEVFSYTVLHKVGVNTLVDSVVHSSAPLEDRLNGASPADAARMRAGIAMQFKFMYVYPILALIFALIAAGVLLATANFGFGGRATYGRMLAVWFYGTLPLAFISILTVVAIYAGMSTDSFNVKNAIGTNAGYYLQDSAPHWLSTLLSSFDVFAIWTACVLTIGVSIVAGIKRSSAAIVVFGWWGLWIVLQTGIAAVSG